MRPRKATIPRDPNSARQQKIQRRTEENLSPFEKERRDRFIAEYLVDFCGSQAWLRAGFAPKYRYQGASTMLSEPYVAARIREAIDAAEESNLINRNRIIAGLVREANFLGINASHSARVTAFNVLAKILGLEAPQKIEHSGGVMLCPMTMKMDDWERTAIETQAKLKANVRD
jgi:hypothetical protein